MWRRFGTVLTIGFALVTLAAAAQTPSSSPPYRPGLGDLMTATVQPRHVKLALAGREQNWTYAAYELHELQEAFERAARAWPQWRKVPIADMVGAVISGPMKEAAQAIQAKDAQKFAAAYTNLTGACNSCHQGAERGFIVIQTPEASSFPDQDFRAPQ